MTEREESKTNAQKLADFLVMERIKLSYRENRDISQSEMAKRIGIPQGSLSQYENATREPNDANRHKLAAYFGPVIYELLDAPLAMPNDPYLRRIAKAWGKLPKDVRRKWADRIEDDAVTWEERSIPDNITTSKAG